MYDHFYISHLLLLFYSKLKFIIIKFIFQSSQMSRIKMSKQKPKQKIVYKLTKNANMRFRPNKIQPVENSTTNGFISRFKSLGKFISFNRNQSVSAKQTTPTNTTNINVVQELANTLTFLYKLQIDGYMIGNSRQLDAFGININDEDIETQHLWSLTLKNPILKLAVDDKRRTIVIITRDEMQIYIYEAKKSKVKPKLNKTFQVFAEIKMIQFSKDSLLTIVYEKEMQFFLIDGANSHQIFKKNFQIGKGFKLLQISQCVDNILNVFFQKEKDRQTFELWSIQVEINSTIKLLPLKKVYEVSQEFKHKIKIESLTKDCYFMNLGQEILAFKKGFKVDEVKINRQSANSLLKYYNDKKLIHISEKQIDFYDFSIDLTANPPKISLTSTDSILIEDYDHQFVFFETIKFGQNMISFFYQAKKSNLAGEIKYYFNLTSKWNFEQKVKHILPKISEYSTEEITSELIEKIEQKFEIVSKMGVSRKDAYLRIWKQSNKKSVEDYKLLLDTLDYGVIRHEILEKLKKKSMVLQQILKIESGCMGMLAKNLFSQKNYSTDSFKNYLTSHFLIRKLQLYRQIKLYQKSTGKLKQTNNKVHISDENKDKLMIDIQQYSHCVQMEIWGSLIELIYNFCKFKKDLTFEIRTTFKHFRFAFRMNYNKLLDQIINVAKDDLLRLLQTIPQLLPYKRVIKNKQQGENKQRGAWITYNQDEWLKFTYLDTVTTIYNKQMILEYADSVWIRRNWFTYHDMIFLTRSEIEAFLRQNSSESIFYNFIAKIFETIKDNNKLLQIINHLQDHYSDFPGHLFNNIFLYRELYLYFKANDSVVQSFRQFLVKSDEQVFKAIFDHQKQHKGTFLKNIKPIFENLKLSQKFNFGLLKFFSSHFSQVSDIKYLLNRINNEKWQFHKQNEQMYEVLIKGMQIKLKLGSDKDIPLEQVLIYIEKIPVGEENPLFYELQTLKKINQDAEKYKKMKLNMSVFQIIRSMDVVMLKITNFSIQHSEFNTQSDFVTMSKKIIGEISSIRQKIYGPFKDNLILFMFLIKSLENIALIPFAHRIIQQNRHEAVQFGQKQLENVVYFCYKRLLTLNSNYASSQTYLKQLISILPETNNLKIFIETQLELASIFETEKFNIKYPISGANGIIQITQLQIIIQKLDKNMLLNLNVDKIHQLSLKLEQIASNGESKQIYLVELYERIAARLINLGALKESVPFIKKIYQLEPNNHNNFIYPAMLLTKFSYELTDQNRNLIHLQARYLFNEPQTLLSTIQLFFSKSFSNEEQKEVLTESLNVIRQQKLDYNVENILLDAHCQTMVKNGDKKQLLSTILKQTYFRLLNESQQFGKSKHISNIYAILMHEPYVLVKYFYINRIIIPTKQIRGILSILARDQIFNTFAVLELGKRLFYALYQSYRYNIKIQKIQKDIATIPLSQRTQRIKLQDNGDSYLKGVVKSISRFDQKIKKVEDQTVRSSKKMGSSGLGVDCNLEKVKKVENRFQNILVSKVPYPEYSFPDSDKDQYQKQYLEVIQRRQGNEAKDFNQRAYILWLNSRKNEPIYHYLFGKSEKEAYQLLMHKESDLNSSFRKMNRDKTLKLNAALIAKAFVKGIKQALDDNKSQFNASNSKNQNCLEDFDIDIPEVPEHNFTSTKIKQQIFKSMVINKEEDRITFDLKILQSYYNNLDLEAILPQIIEEIYNDSANFTNNLMLIKQIYMNYPKISPINIQFIDIYLKIEHLQSKYMLDLPIKQILPLQGLLIKEKDTNALFSYIKPFIIPFLTQNNVYTLSRIISLSFKNNDIQQIIQSEFYKFLLLNLDKDALQQKDEQMEYEKMQAFIKKMPISILLIQTQQILSIFKHKDRINKIVQTISKTIRDRKEIRTAEAFESRWLISTS